MRSVENCRFVVSSFYCLRTIQKTEDFVSRIRAIGEDLRGLIIVAPEGFNGTVSGLPEAVDCFKRELCIVAGTQVEFKDSSANAPPFGKYQVRIRSEVITSGLNLQIPAGGLGNRISPEEWDRVIREEEVQILDTRNRYETSIGKFRGAIDPGIGVFSELRDFLGSSTLDRTTKTLVYCTGGIRCEKAVLEMERQGFRDVYQLDGGILAYLAQSRGGLFEGECFVFDDRVAVTCELEPTSRYCFCEYCGQPAECVAVEEGALGSSSQVCAECSGRSRNRR